MPTQLCHTHEKVRTFMPRVVRSKGRPWEDACEPESMPRFQAMTACGRLCSAEHAAERGRGGGERAGALPAGLRGQAPGWAEAGQPRLAGARCISCAASNLPWLAISRQQGGFRIQLMLIEKEYTLLPGLAGPLHVYQRHWRLECPEEKHW